jgi:hypothetical protein
MAESLLQVADSREEFQMHYRAAVTDVVQPASTAVCTVYDPHYSDPVQRHLGTTAGKKVGRSCRTTDPANEPARLITRCLPLTPQRRAKAPPLHLLYPGFALHRELDSCRKCSNAEEFRGLAGQMHRKLSHL